MSIQEKENNKVNGTGELDQEQMEKVAGGDFADDFHCRFGSHKFVLDIQKGSGAKPYEVNKYICSNCGKVKYTKNYDNGTVEEISEEAFEKYW